MLLVINISCKWGKCFRMMLNMFCHFLCRVSYSGVFTRTFLVIKMTAMLVQLYAIYHSKSELHGVSRTIKGGICVGATMQLKLKNVVCGFPLQHYRRTYRTWLMPSVLMLKSHGYRFLLSFPFTNNILNYVTKVHLTLP